MTLPPTSSIKALLLMIASAFISISTLHAVLHIEGAEERVYKNVDRVEMKLWGFTPQGVQSEAAPAMVFFFGGGWNGGSAKQFVYQSQYLAQRGMVGIVADYRVKSRHGVQAKSCVEDALDALRYVKKHAEGMGIDPDRIGAGGGSAGGHLAACLGTIYADDDSAPSALALYNPATVLAPINVESGNYEQSIEALTQANHMLESRQGELHQRLGVPTSELSPFHHVSNQTPPTIIFHGTKDKTVPYISAAVFSKKLQANNVDVVMKTYEGSGHGFFNKEPFRSQTTQSLDEFLTSLGWLK